MKNVFLIINYNDYHTAKTLIDHIKDYSCIDLIVVVDNKSSDDSYKRLTDININKLDVIQNSSNLGYASGINFGSKYIINKYKSAYIIISNSDIIINSENDIKTLLDIYKKDNDIAVVAPTIVENNNLNRGWIIPTPMLDFLLNLVIVNKFLKKRMYYKDDYYNSDYSIVEVVSGCFFIIRSQILEKINYLDENTFLYYEENILATKLKKENKKSVVSNKVKVIHNHSVTIDKSINKIKKYNLLKKSSYYFHTKYNNASLIEKFLLKISVFITRRILSIKYKMEYIFKRGK